MGEQMITVMRDNHKYEAESVLEILSELRVFDIEKLSDGTFQIIDGCDGCFDAILTQQQMHQLIDELQEKLRSQK
jgi:hypothetical protein